MARALGDHPTAREEVHRALTVEGLHVPRYSWPLIWLGLRVEAEAEEPAADWLAELKAMASELPATTPPALAMRALVTAETAGKPDWDAAIAACRATDDPYLVAYALLRSAQVHCAAGDREAATPALEEAARLAAGLGAAPLLEEIRAVARRARVTLAEDEAAPAGAGIEAFGLTQREREVLELLADGRSNQQIAEELFITRKTASVHVSNILGKLGVASRGEATAMAHRLRAA
jgi:DNA-binding NarL/FixJ family response regulator